MTITSGKDQSDFLPRRSIASGDRVPNHTLFITRTAIEFLQVIFSRRARGQLKWDKDITNTEIQISDVHAVNLTNKNQRPMIIAVRGPLGWQGLGLGGNSLESRNMPTGDRIHNDLLTGSIALNCISREGVEAEQIAYLVANSFKFFGSELRKFGFFSIKSLNIGAESLIEQEGSEDLTSLVPVYITASVQERVSIKEEVARPLREIIINVLKGED